jgi:hypothetical protein
MTTKTTRVFWALMALMTIQLSAFVSSEAWGAQGVPDSVYRDIAARAKGRHPGDSSTQAYVIQKQCDAYRRIRGWDSEPNVPLEVFNRIKNVAGAEHINDYSTQLYVIQRECEAYLAIERMENDRWVTYGELNDIKAKAAKRHPDSYRTQKYIIDKEILKKR